MELNIGSNVIRDTTGVLVVEDQEQIELEISEDGQTLLSMDVYDEEGKHVAKLRRNAWSFNEAERFSITTSPESLKLIEDATGRVVVEARVVDQSHIAIPSGRFYTPLGHLIDITPDALVMGGARLSGNLISSNGQALYLDTKSFGIG